MLHVYNVFPFHEQWKMVLESKINMTNALHYDLIYLGFVL